MNHYHQHHDHVAAEGSCVTSVPWQHWTARLHRLTGCIPLSARTYSRCYEIDRVGVPSRHSGSDPVMSRLGKGVPDWLTPSVSLATW